MKVNLIGFLELHERTAFHLTVLVLELKQPTIFYKLECCVPTPPPAMVPLTSYDLTKDHVDRCHILV